MINKSIDKLTIDTIRMLAVDAVQKANSGHPGMPLGFAAPLYVLYKNHLNFSTKNSNWINRDRFVLSAGHGSALLYAMNHLAGYAISLDDLKNFRQLNSCTPGHPEYCLKEGIEVTTGPLGQGLGMAVGFAVAEKYLNKLFQSPGKSPSSLINHFTYCVVGDGDLQEGISHEALSLAGYLNLNKLIVLFDSNKVQLDSMTDVVINDNYKLRLQSYNWNYILVDKPYDLDVVDNAIKQAKIGDQPTLIEFRTIIGKDSALANNPKVHGAPFNQKSYLQLKENLGFKDQYFHVSPEVYRHCYAIFQTAKLKKYDQYLKLAEQCVNDNTDIYLLYQQFLNGKVKISFKKLLSEIDTNEPVATRTGSQKVLTSLNMNPFLLAGSADLSGSTMVKGNNGHFCPDNLTGQEMKYGVREFVMGAVSNGISLHSNLRSVCATFLVFSDYLKPAIRLAALMKLPSVFCFSHDSVFLGEDGPTHQPIEQLAMLRSVPNLYVFRPCNNEELIAAYDMAFAAKKTPSAIITSRQKIDAVPSTDYQKALGGGYIVKDETQKLTAVIIATGSEVPLATKLANLLEKNCSSWGIRVVSMLSYEVFFKKPAKDRWFIIPPNSKIINLEVSSPYGRRSFENPAQLVIGISTFGASAKFADNVIHFHFDIESIFGKIFKFLNK